MTNEDDSSNSRFNRRKVLAGLGAGAAAGVAGCSGGGDGEDGGDGGTATGTATMTETMTETDMGDGGDGGMTATETPTETDTTTDSGDGGDGMAGGQLVLGMAVAPTTMNVVQASSVYSSMVSSLVYNFGTSTNPLNQEFAPWTVTDWTVTPENAKENPDSPTLTATIRDDLTHHDGETVDTEDYAWTARFMRDQNPSTGISGAAFQAIPDDNGVVVQSPTEFEVYMKQKDQRWFTSILGAPFLPKHIWQDHRDTYQEYSPRTEDEVIGGGPFQLNDFNWQNWYEFSTAYDVYPPAAADYATWFDDVDLNGPPYIDGIRFEVFGSQSAMEQALLNDEIDGGFVAGGFTVQNAIQAQRSDNFTVHQSSEAGYNHLSYNLRRRPFDDTAFVQFLNKLMDKQWIVDEPYQGIAAVKGDYVVIPALGQWRPPEPEELAGSDYASTDEFEPVSMPDLSFPNPGQFNLNQSQVDSVRQWLINNTNAEYDYSWGEGYSNFSAQSIDGKEIYIDGQPLTEFHTDNDGNAGQGPLVFSFQPPQEDLYQARTGQQYIGLLRRVGIPTEQLVKTINAQIPTVYAQEDFDMYSMGWGLGINVTYLSALYSSEGADLDGTDDAQNFNPMGYTGADDLIQQDRQLMDFEERIPVVKQILATIYHDAPTNITDVAQLLEPTSNQWTGWIEGLGSTIDNSNSWLNVRQQG